ncbi:hypothetical protein Tco_0940886 [Tanacetum coccineum]|uniref:Uncharacterized protein n=1 Tax=Tanacetum coccineum TaxID=301880 RepID=A0ABQ5DPA3_9ASTR
MHFAVKRAEEKRNKPPTKAQQRKIMCTYLKNMEGYKLKDLKLKEFDSIQEMFDRAFKRVNTFEDFRTELVKGKEKRAGIELIQEITKKQKGDLKTIFEPRVEDEIYMLVEKKYPLAPLTLSMMLEKKLIIDYESEMAYQLLKFIMKQLKNGSGKARGVCDRELHGRAIMKIRSGAVIVGSQYSKTVQDARACMQRDDGGEGVGDGGASGKLQYTLEMTYLSTPFQTERWGTSNDENDIEGIIDYLEPTSYDGFVDLDEEEYNKRRCRLLGMPYIEPLPIIIEQLKITRYSLGPGEVYTKLEVSNTEELPRTRNNVATIRSNIMEEVFENYEDEMT